MYTEEQLQKAAKDREELNVDMQIMINQVVAKGQNILADKLRHMKDAVDCITIEESIWIEENTESIM